jgi:hypothetical protein
VSSLDLQEPKGGRQAAFFHALQVTEGWGFPPRLQADGLGFASLVAYDRYPGYG